MALKIYVPEKFEKISVELPVQLVDYVDEYLAYLEACGKTGLSRNLVIEAMCDDSLSKSRIFSGFRELEKKDDILSVNKEKKDERKTTENPKLPVPKSKKYDDAVKRKESSSKSFGTNGIENR